jgi:hypothetical protein
MKTNLRLFRLLLPLLMTACPAMAQSTFGSIVGTVQDPSGSGVPAASITVTDLDENTSRSVVSGGNGLYQFVNMKPGRYSVKVDKSGFASAQVSELTLDARQERRLDLTLSLANVQQSVQVEATAAVINTENANISNTMNNQAVADLPANYRGSSTSPLGAIVGSANVQQDQNGNIALTGSLPFMTDYSVDGSSTVNVISNSAARNMYPSSEMLSEFRVSAINNNAEFAASGDVTVTTKSGGNTLHGSLFEYAQNTALDATTYGSAVKQAKVWNTFGGSLNGPVVIPHVYNGHNKTFFFIDYEGNRKPGSGLVVDNVPTAAMVSGNLNGLPGKPAVNPFTGLPFPNNQIPANMLNPVAQKLLTQYYPGPNYNSGSTTGNYRTLEPLANQTDGYDIRIDQAIGSKNQLYGRWTWKNLPYQTLSTANSTAQLLPPVSNTEGDRNLLISDSHIITSTLVNELRFGWSTLSIQSGYPFSGASVVNNLGLTGLDLSNAGNSGGFTGFNFSSGTGFTKIGRGEVGPQSSRTFQYTDNVSWIKGQHTMKFGVDVRSVKYNRVNNFGGSDEFGSLRFTGAFSGNAFADLLLGIPAADLVYTIGPNIDSNSGHFATYAQDEWRIRKNITISAGLRWELQPPFIENNGNIGNFLANNGGMVIPNNAKIPAAPSVLYSINACSLNPLPNPALPCSPVETASQAGLGQGLRQTYWKDFDPRIGIAWRPFNDDKTVLRAGIGIFTVPQLGGVAYQMTGTAATNSPTYTNAMVNGQPLFTLPSMAYGNGGLVPSLVGTYTFDVAQQTNFRDPQSAQWNVTVERQLGSAGTARLSYIGSNAYRLPVDTDPNQTPPSAKGPYKEVYPQWASIYQLGNWGFANYQDLEAQFTRRYSSGLYFQATYDFAKDLTDANNDAPVGFGNEQGNGGGPYGLTTVTDRFSLRNERGNDPGVRRNRFLLTGMYDLPFGSGRHFLSKSNMVVNALLGGWSLNTITLVESGPFQTPYDGNQADSQANLGEAARNTVVRPDIIGSCSIANPGPNGWFNLAAFVPTPAGAGRIGNSGVGICEGPGTVTIAAGVGKTFKINERAKLKFNASFTNILNHPNFAPPPVDISSRSTFGVTQTVQSSENGGNRVGQLSLRLDF